MAKVKNHCEIRKFLGNVVKPAGQRVLSVGKPATYPRTWADSIICNLRTLPANLPAKPA
jgi:hypothetical protein